MVNALLLAPPVAFLIVLVAMLAELWGLKIFSAGLRAPKEPGGRFKAYACGEDVKDHRAQPDYSQFFHFAFYFTILHVVALFVSTVPTETAGAIAIALLYIAGAVIGMFILLEK